MRVYFVETEWTVGDERDTWKVRIQPNSDQNLCIL